MSTAVYRNMYSIFQLLRAKLLSYVTPPTTPPLSVQKFHFWSKKCGNIQDALPLLLCHCSLLTVIRTQEQLTVRKKWILYWVLVRSPEEAFVEQDDFRCVGRSTRLVIKSAAFLMIYLGSGNNNIIKLMLFPNSHICCFFFCWRSVMFR